MILLLAVLLVLHIQCLDFTCHVGASGRANMEAFPGPFCQKLQLSHTVLSCKSPPSVKATDITNGTVLELKSFYKKTNDVVEVLKLLNDNFKTSKDASIQSKISRVSDYRKKFSSKRRVKGYTSLEHFLSEPFKIGSATGTSTQLVIPSQSEPAVTSTIETFLSDLEVTSSSKDACDDVVNKECAPNGCDNDSSGTSVGKESPLDMCESKELSKKSNLLQYEVLKKEANLRKLTKEIECTQEKQRVLATQIGHYSVRNVNKRDAIHRKNMHLLRDSQRTVIKQEKRISKLSDAMDKLREEVKNLTHENEELKNEKKDLQTVEKKKIHAQKALSYYKQSAKKLRDKMASDAQVRELKMTIANKDAQIQQLEINIEELHEERNGLNIPTKGKDGSYSDHIRLCVIELTGLEVAVEKVSLVMSAVSKHLFGRDFEIGELPSASTIQTMVDEGHFLAKTYIAEKLKETEHWGLNRDGTTRRKQKILDTSVTLASGDVMSLGFTKVSRETAHEINNTTKQHLYELADLNDHDNRESYIQQSLVKLSFTMSDRAANEKKANELLDEWRDEELNECDGAEDRSEVQHFYCMAHVLLGFHSYCCKDLKPYLLTLANEHGPLGKDNNTFLRHWSGRSSALERVVRTTAEVFGPAGDHHGVRDLWEAYCAENGIKSLVGNYKDNRFNALFQTSAEIHLHRKDFIHVLESVKSPNLKLQAVLLDLRCSILSAMMQSYGLIYLKITGPFWNLMTKSAVPYLQLNHHIIQLHKFLQDCYNDPALILQDGHWSTVDPEGIADVPRGQRLRDCLLDIPEEHRDVLFETIKLAVQSMCRTVEKQLVDFLPGGKFSSPPSEADMTRTGFAHRTNLGCEHHFGDLDSSQRRRPSASMHHHSSIQLLKRNRTSMAKWLHDMPNDSRKELLKSARQGGKDLRETHIFKEQIVLAEIHSDLVNQKVQKRRRESNGTEQPRNRRKETENDTSVEDREQQLLEDLSHQQTISVNDYVAVAYQDKWYPGIVTQMKDDDMTLTVKFLEPTRKADVFKWPSRDDIQTVKKEFVLKAKFIPECQNSWILWKVAEFLEINELYNRYRNIYFD